MKTILLLLAVGAASIFAVRVGIANNERSVELAGLATARDGLREKILRAELRLSSARQADEVAVAATSTGTEPANVAAAPRKPSVDAVIANDPQRRAEVLRNFREIVAWNRAGMFKAVGFSPEQIEKWKDLRVEMEQRRLDLVAAVEAQGLTPRSDAFKALEAENERFRRMKETEILGSLEPAYREYERVDGLRTTSIGGAGVTCLADVALYSAESITPAQVDQTVQILAANSDLDVDPQAGRTKPAAVNWDVAAGQLKEILSPSQVSALRAIFEQVAKNESIYQQISARTATLTAQFKTPPPPK